MAWTDGILIRAVNIIVFFFSLSGNIYNTVSPDGTYGAGKETYVREARGHVGAVLT